MEVSVYLHNLRIAPRKVRLVLDLIRGKNVPAAEHQLSFLSRGAAQPLLKLLRSAKANAKNNFELDPETMYVKSVTADEGNTLKRYMPRAHGAAYVIRKRASHVTLVIAERNKEKPAEKKSEDKKADSKPKTTKQKTTRPEGSATPKKKTAAQKAKKTTKTSSASKK